jgi:hypothetical protein
MEDVVRQSQTYAATLQNYNTSLQADVQVRRSCCVCIIMLLCIDSNPSSQLYSLADHLWLAAHNMV